MAGKSNRSADIDDQGRYRAITDDILLLAAGIRTAFFVIRQNYVPGAGANQRKDKDLFLRAAFRCREAGLDAETFVFQRVTAAIERHAELYPTILISDKLDQVAVQTSKSAEEASLASLNCQIALFVRRSLNFTPAEILRDPMVDLTALFRFCMAMRYTLPRIADEFREQAKLELKISPLAHQVFPAEVALL